MIFGNTDRFSQPMPYETDYGVERDVETEQEIEAERADKWQEQKGDEE